MGAAGGGDAPPPPHSIRCEPKTTELSEGVGLEGVTTVTSQLRVGASKAAAEQAVHGGGAAEAEADLLGLGSPSFASGGGEKQAAPARSEGSWAI